MIEVPSRGMSSTLAVRVAAVLGFLAVSLGAFGAHGLAGLLESHGTARQWETAVLYHFIHAIALLALALREPVHRGPFICFLAGMIIFSGSLYLLALTNLRWLGAVTPFGGVSFLIGWGWLAAVPFRKS
jgi:uncharacterized membrane protein YgdD (TMEM256/DUF423 family)